MKKKLLFAYDFMMTGGTTTSMLSLLESIDKEKYDIDLILNRHGGGFFKNIPKEVNVLEPALKYSGVIKKSKKLLISFFNGQLFKACFFYLKNRKNKSKSFAMAIWQSTEQAHASISRKLNKEYDVAIGFIESWGAHYVVSDKVKAKKRIIWIHPDIEKSYMIAEIDKKMYKLADTVVTVSDECRNNLAKCLPQYNEKIICIENIVNVKRTKELAEQEIDFSVDTSKINIVSVGRISYYDKGLDRVLNSFLKLNQEKLLENLVWYVIGIGQDKSDMEAFIAKNGLEPYIKLLGRQQNPFAYEKYMDMLLLPSRYEGKPMAVTEAQILGLPCAVTNYAAAAEQVNNGVDGIIIENSEQGIYKFLKDLCLHKYNLKELKENTLKKDFSNKETIKKIEELF